jgi:hypothetical protein
MTTGSDDLTFVRMAYFPGATTDHFDAVARQVPSEVPRGRLLFAAGPVDGGWQVIQAWESRELLDTYNREVYFPALAAVGTQAFPQPPDVVDFEPAFLSLTSDLLP